MLFRNRFGYCDYLSNFGINKEKCVLNNKEWKIYPFNFDNIYNSLLTLFAVSTLDGWSAIMNVAVNSDIEENGPSPFNNQYSSYIYFISFVLFGTLFLINLFIGVIFYNFTLAQKQTKHKFLTEAQVTWLSLHKLIILADPHFHYAKPPSTHFKRIVYNVIGSKPFRLFIYFCLIANFIVLCINDNNLDSANFNYMLILIESFNLIFVIEGLLKIYAFSFKGYFYNSWNQLDFFIIITAVLDLFVVTMLHDHEMIVKVPQLIKGLRIVRILRFLRIMRKKKGVDNLIHILIFSLPMVLNIFALLMFIYYLFVMLGYLIFHKIVKGDVIDDYINFKNFSYSLMTMFKVSTADGWEGIMLDVQYHYGN